MIVSIPNTITRGEISIYLAANYNAKKALFNGAIASPRSPVTIAMITDALNWGYLGGQNSNNVRGLANYAIWMYGAFGLQAQYIMTGSGGGSVLPPSGGGGSGTGLLRLVITNSNLSGNDFNDPRIVGKNIQIFISGYNEEWLYAPDSFVQTATGITITATGFDPANFSYQIIIQEFIPVPGAIITLATPTNIVRSFGPGFTEVKYDWDDVLHATGYVWQLASDFSFTSILASGTVGVSQVVITLGAVAPPLYFRVYATAPGYAQSAYGSAFFTPGQLATPSLSFSNISSSSFQTLWTMDANSDQMSIDIATDASFSTIVQSATGANAGSWVFSGASPGILYYIRVKQKSNPPWYPSSDYGFGNHESVRIFDPTFDNIFN